MSADNGVYIGTFGDEHRVIHAQAIENVEYQPDFDGFNSEQVVAYYKDAPCFKTMAAATKHANRLADEIESDPICPILEYGISLIDFKHSFAEFEEKCAEMRSKYVK